MGRVLLGGLPEPDLEKYLQTVQIHRYTNRSLSDVEQLRAEVKAARDKGWSMVAEELEEGLRGVAVPVRRGSEIVAAANVSLQTHRASSTEVEKTVLPQLKQTAGKIALDYSGPASRH